MSLPAALITGAERFLTADELREQGRGLRRQMPRSAHAEWVAPANRPDPVAIIEAGNEGRRPDLVPLRIARMAADPFAFLRGSAAVMAMDLARTPCSGPVGIICGDAHVSNVGFYASAEGMLVCDLNDFDEAAIGPWEWDLKRCAASVVVAGRGSGFDPEVTTAAAEACVAAYRASVNHFAKAPVTELWAGRWDVLSLALARLPHLRDDLEHLLRKAARNDSARFSAKWTVRTGTAGWRFTEQPPVLTRLHGEERTAVMAGLLASVEHLADERKSLSRRLRGVDAAFRVVGVGSVGTHAYVVLLQGPNDEPLVMQVKEARPSVLRPYLGEQPAIDHEGERVVRAQRRMQASSDPLLSWTTIGDRQFLVRQFRNMKGSLDAALLDPGELVEYAELCGVVIARAHARSIQPAMLDGYCGTGRVLDRAIGRFAEAYADQTEADYRLLVEAIAEGRLPAAADPLR